MHAPQKHDPGASPDNDHFWHVVVRGPEVMLNWGKARVLAARLRHRHRIASSHRCLSVRHCRVAPFRFPSRFPAAQVNTPGKSEVRHFADGLLAEAWAADSVTEKMKSGYVVHEGEGAAQTRQEGIPREPVAHHSRREQ